VTRLARGLLEASAGRAFSITGPHGGGKSSLAVFLDALLANRSKAEHKAALQLLVDVDPVSANAILEGLEAVDPRGQGFVRAFVTADREPVGDTIARALHDGAVREFGEHQRTIPKSFARGFAGKPIASMDIMQALRDLSSQMPVVIILDEFGKNLEAYAESGQDGDPFLLQELAEACQG
jgi:hypothetical protein